MPTYSFTGPTTQCGMVQATFVLKPYDQRCKDTQVDPERIASNPTYLAGKFFVTDFNLAMVSMGAPLVMQSALPTPLTFVGATPINSLPVPSPFIVKALDELIWQNNTQMEILVASRRTLATYIAPLECTRHLLKPDSPEAAQLDKLWGSHNAIPVSHLNIINNQVWALKAAKNLADNVLKTIVREEGAASVN